MQPMFSASADATASGRIAVVDVLRAFALFGIIVNHGAMAFLAGAPPDPKFNTFGPLDELVGEWVRLLTFGKFFAIFSFLFGLSFALQLDSAARKGQPFSGRFAWRLTLLLLIAVVHGMFFSGDILLIYALLGFLLIPLQRLPSRALIVIALILMLNIPGLVLGVSRMSAPPPSTSEQQQAQAQTQENLKASRERQFQIKQSGTVSEVIRMNLTDTMVTKLRFQIFTGRLWMTFGFFLLGMCAGRLRLFQLTEANRRFFRRLLVWSGTVGLVATIIAYLYPSPVVARSLAEVWSGFAFSIQQVTLAAFFVALVTLWHWRRPSLLAALAPMGKMGLTTYLTQSVFGLLLFYGFGLGLMGKIGIAACVGLSILFFFVQIAIARAWMRRYNMGPVEWLWRSLTYLKFQPNARTEVGAAQLS